jgi:hypothetical protein
MHATHPTRARCLSLGSDIHRPPNKHTRCPLAGSYFCWCALPMPGLCSYLAFETAADGDHGMASSSGKLEECRLPKPAPAVGGPPMDRKPPRPSLPPGRLLR